MAAQRLGRLQSDVVAVHVVVRALDDAVLVRGTEGEEERARRVTTGDRQLVVQVRCATEQFTEVIVRDGASSERGAPVTTSVRCTSRAGGEVTCRRYAALTETVRALQRDGAVDIVEVEARRPGITRRTGSAALGCDEHDTVCCALSVNSGCSGALQNLDRLDICRVHVDQAVGCNCTATVAAA